jgi:hypothetical protein
MGQILTLPMIALGLWLILRRQDRDMTDLKSRLIERISRHGPMTLAEYMTECLLHPDLGYYTRKDPLGRAGDFITAPEISQMFGELIGLWLAQVWMDQGAPGDAILLEMGPGRGTLMADALRATRGVPGFHAAMACTSSRPRRICARFSDRRSPRTPRSSTTRWTPSRSVPSSPSPTSSSTRCRFGSSSAPRAGSGTNAWSGCRTGRSPSASPRRHRSPRSSPASPIRNRA